MTTEEQKLVLKDLFARVPYAVKCQFNVGTEEEPIYKIVTFDNELDDLHVYWVKEGWFKPYLRSMSTMTEKERNEYLSIKMQECERVALAEVDRPEAISVVIDWLNAHHFDYRGLIEKGLALEAPEGMYKPE